ncbi:SGS-domain-containing protein [Linderina pennispora]|uniref:SGS-domain-containing protein n=1 Tax=Linderina pennispora TaxID=61395 RepID=A0A1Y1WFW2_9FUNG|nr:SGS-domain-containing protein [Linderina pennispora]ORX72372.1 SGS-domain-containing protein [Linderina pennispora]
MSKNASANKQAAKELAQQAIDAYMDDDFERAESLYTQAIASDATVGDYYLKRAQVRHKLSKTDLATSDALKAADLTASKTIYLRTYYKALVLHGEWSFAQEKYAEAVESLHKATKINPNDEKVSSLLEKAEALAPAPAPAPEPVAEEPKEEKPVEKKRHAVRHEWYQNDEDVIVEVFVRNVKKESLEVEFTDSALSLSIKMPTGAENNLDFDPLLLPIVPSQSTYEILSTKIEVRMKKAAKGEKWSHLEKTEAEMVADVKPSHLSNSRKGVSWDKIAADAEKETALKVSEQGVNQLFQTIYKDADEDTRRAMMKSYVESNGTALSTDWESVKKGPVETLPPTGCDAKPFKS